MTDDICMLGPVLAADMLLKARRTGQPIEELPDDLAPASLHAAYHIQDLHVAGLLGDGKGPTIGYKIGCTNASAQALLGADRPFHGRLLQGFAKASPAVLQSDGFFFRCIEAEFAFRLARDLAADRASFARGDVAAAIGAILPAIEIVDSRYVDWRQVGLLALIADNGSAGQWVCGPDQADWQRFDLAGHPVTLRVNGKVEREGSSANVLGNPLDALTFLANDLASRGHGLRAGEVVSTGTAIEVYFARPGDAIEADFGGLGKVALQFNS